MLCLFTYILLIVTTYLFVKELIVARERIWAILFSSALHLLVVK